MEKRIGNILWSKGGSGSDTTRITLPVAWIRKMGLSKNSREVELSFDKNTNKIIIKSEVGKMKITEKEIEKNLMNMIEQEFDYNDIICAFEDFNDEDNEEHIIISEVEGKEYQYLVYAEHHGPQFGIVVTDGIIKNIYKF